MMYYFLNPRHQEGSAHFVKTVPHLRKPLSLEQMSSKSLTIIKCYYVSIQPANLIDCLTHQPGYILRAAENFTKSYYFTLKFRVKSLLILHLNLVDLL